MKRFGWLFWLLIWGAVPASYAQIAALTGYCNLGATQASTSGLKSTNYLNGVIPKCTVTVYLTGTQTLATIYSDGSSTPLANPFTSTTSGQWTFFSAVNVGYDVVLSGGVSPNIYPSPVTLTGLYPGFSFSGGGGSGNVLPSPQYRLFLQPNAGTQAVAAGAVQGQNGVAPMLQGNLNPDLYATGGGNNGIANALASADCGAACTVVVPPTSTDTESAYYAITSGNHIVDQRGQSVGDFFYNPALGGAAGFNPHGSSRSVGKAISAKWDKTTYASGNYSGQEQTALAFWDDFNAPGFYYGTWGGTYPGSLWATTKAINIVQNVSTPSIAEIISGQQTKTSSGDSALAYLYGTSDGGCSSGADECSVGIGLHDDQASAWFHGNAAAGATTGTQLLPVTYVAGTNSRPAVSVGGVMLDISRITLSDAHVTGIAVQVPGYAAWATPIDATVTVSTAWGLAQAAIPTPMTTGTPQSDTVSFSVDGGTNAGGFQVGTACLDGAAKIEQVQITAVGTLTSGLQDVTFTHRYPNPQAGTSLWQGGLCGTYYMSTEAYYSKFNGTATNWRTDYPVFGARTSNEIVGRFLTNAGASLATSKPIPNFWNANTANLPLTSLTVSGTTVTAHILSPTSSRVFDGQGQAVISAASNSAFNGTVSNVKVINNGSGLTWTQTGVSGTSATAQISYTPIYFSFYLFPGAAVVQPATSAGVPLEPNSAPWTVGDHLENPFDPAFGGYLMGLEHTANSPDSSGITNIGSINIGAAGAGISGQYRPFQFNNFNAVGMYVGGGGWLQPPTIFTTVGPTSTVFKTQYAPIDGSAVFDLGCAIATQGGCGNATNDLRIIAVDGKAGQINYTPQTKEWYLNNIKTAQTRSTVLSTGDGAYVNGGFTGVPVALTAASAIRANGQPGLGTYGAFGNEGILDTSATIAAKSFYGGTLYAGAAPPTITSVQPNGASGSSTFSYVATSVTQNGESLPSATATTTSANATLSATNFNAVDLQLGYGAQSTNVYRTAAPGGYSLGLICSVPNNLISGTFNTPACADTGQTATGSVPTSDTSGNLQVAGKNVCLADGTNCPAVTVIPKGRATLAAGTVTVSSGAASTSAIYSLTNCGVGGTQGMLTISAISSGVSFTITSSSATDTSNVCWVIQ